MSNMTKFAFTIIHHNVNTKIMGQITVDKKLIVQNYIPGIH